MKRILFVDDEPLILDALQRLLVSMRHEWKMQFAGSGAEALQMMAVAPADVVITDMRMPQMNGAQLLNEIMRRHPKTVRMILSGYSDTEMILQSVGGTHQFLSKPCSSEILRSVVGRALEMDQRVNNDEIKTFVARLGVLPSIPAIYFEMLKELSSPEAALYRVGDAIAKDPAMTSKILQLANSAFFGLSRQLSSPHEAVMQLGLDTIKSLVLGIHIFSEIKVHEKATPIVQKLWHHSLATAGLARRIAVSEHHDKRLVDESFTGGMLHDIGKLILLASMPGEYEEALKQSQDDDMPLVEVEKVIFGANHSEIGGYLLGLWGLPVSLAEAVVYHHCPSECSNRSFSALSLVHVANILEHEKSGERFIQTQLDRDYLTELGMWERIANWRKIAHAAPGKNGS
jgi:HD-like signal output (HDOD) protein/CheY-like chemotaxis protein